MKRRQSGVIVRGMIWVWLLASLLVGSTSRAATFEDIVVDELAAPRPLVHFHGYVEYRFRVVNNSTDTPHVVKIILPQRNIGSKLILQRSVSVPPQVEAQVSIWKPAVELYGNTAAVRIDGALQESGLPVDMVRDGSDAMQYSYYHSSSLPRSILVSQRVDSAVRDHLDALATQVVAAVATSSGSTPPSTTDFGLQRTSLPLTQWSDSWLSYSAFDGVMVTTEDLRVMPVAVSQALLAYVELGGYLTVVGDDDLPAKWQSGEAWRSVPGVPYRHHSLGLGKVTQLSQQGLLGLSMEQFKQLDEATWGQSFSNNMMKMDVDDANSAFPVVDTLGVPARSMLAIMMLFALLIGPANMFFFAYLDRRLWTLVTIPVLAGVFSAGVFLFTILADGIWAEGRATTLTLLDQSAGRATTIGWLGYYAPLQPSDGLKFDTHTAINLQNQSSDYRGYGSSQNAGSRAIDWTSSQHLQTGWVNSRIPAHFTLRKSQARRERLVVTQDAQGNVTVVNGLGSDITELKLRDPAGGLHVASQPIAAGAKATLVRSQEAVPSNELLGMFAGEWKINPQSLQRALGYEDDSLKEEQDQRMYLDESGNPITMTLPTVSPKRSTYIAKLKDPIFIEPGLAKMKAWNTRTAVYGSYTLGQSQEAQP